MTNWNPDIFTFILTFSIIVFLIRIWMLYSEYQYRKTKKYGSLTKDLSIYKQMEILTPEEILFIVNNFKKDITLYPDSIRYIEEQVVADKAKIESIGTILEAHSEKMKAEDREYYTHLKVMVDAQIQKSKNTIVGMKQYTKNAQQIIDKLTKVADVITKT